jgi:lipopolysaccharide export system protein LptA
MFCCALEAKAIQNKEISSPIEITSDELTLYQKEQKAVFHGKVKVTQDNMIMTANEMVIYYIKGSNDASLNKNKVSLIEAIGNVEITTPNEHVKGEKGEYFMNKEILVLSGSVVLVQGGNVLTGSKFIYDKNKGEWKVTSEKSAQGSERAKALIIPGQK